MPEHLDLSTIIAGASEEVLAGMGKPEGEEQPLVDKGEASTKLAAQKKLEAKVEPAPKEGAEPAKAEAGEGANPESTDATETGDETGAPVLPEGYVSIEAVTDGLATEFTMRDAAGEAIEVPAIVVEYKANGRVRKDRIDQVVKLAQWGVYNQEREQAILQKEEQAREAVKPWQERALLREQQLEKLLDNEEEYTLARERWLAANTPDKQVARMEEKLRQKESEHAQTVAAFEAKTFLEEDILPALDTIVEALPEVTFEELENRMAVAILPYRQANGTIPKARYDAIRQYIVHDLAPWAKDLHERRMSRVAEKTKAADKKVSDAQAKTQQVKREVGRAMKPVTGGAPSNGTQAGKKASAMTLDEALKDAEANVLEGLNL